MKNFPILIENNEKGYGRYFMGYGRIKYLQYVYGMILFCLFIEFVQ